MEDRAANRGRENLCQRNNSLTKKKQLDEEGYGLELEEQLRRSKPNLKACVQHLLNLVGAQVQIAPRFQ